MYLLRLEVVVYGDIREALDELELVLDLAALVGDLLLGPVDLLVSGSLSSWAVGRDDAYCSSWSALAPSLSET